jgi:hypothetical protein
VSEIAAAATEPAESSAAPEQAGLVQPLDAALTNFMAPAAPIGHSQQAPQSAAQNAPEPARSAASALEAGDHELAFNFDSLAAPSALIAVVESKVTYDPPVPPGSKAKSEAILKVGATVLDEHGGGQENSLQHHGTVLSHHDLLI